MTQTQSKQMARPVKRRTSGWMAAGLDTPVSGARLPRMMARPPRVLWGLSRLRMSSGLEG